MRNTGKFLAIAMLFCAFLFGSVTPASAESIQFIGPGGFNSGPLACTNGCFGNDIDVIVTAGAGFYDVSIVIDFTGNNNQNAEGIGAVSFVLSGFSYVANQVSIIAAPTAVGDWSKSPGPASASGGGCQASSNNSICAYDVSLYPASGDPSGISAAIDVGGGAGPIRTWTFRITGQTFGGFDSESHVQVVFGELIEGSENGCPGNDPPCFKERGLISTGGTNPPTVPEPTTLTLLGVGLGVAAIVRRRINR